jgi:hypothetical protein
VIERVVIGVLIAVAVPAVVVSLRLMAGPIDLGFLRAYITHEYDSPAGKVKFDAERIYAEWAGLSEPMRLVFNGVQVVGADNQQIATAPSVALSFEPRSVIRGHLLPTAVVVERPTLDLDVAREGGMLRRVLAKGGAGSQEKVVDLLVEQLLAEANHDSLLGQLDTVRVERARVTVRDVPSGLVWVAPTARASLRRDADGVIIRAHARFSGGGEPVDVALSGTYGRDRSRIVAEARIEGLKPSMLADMSPDVDILRGIDIALAGRLAIEADGTGAIRTAAITVTGGSGTLNLPGILPAAHKVHSVNAHASIDAATHTARIDHVDVDLGMTKVSIVGDGLKTEQGQVFTGRAEVRNIPIDRLGDYWPLEFAEGGRAWSLANLSGGSIDVAAEFGLSAPGNDIARMSVTRLVGLINYRDMKVHYMPHMPELEGVVGTARFEGGTLHFDVEKGTAVGLRLAGATIDLTGLDGPAPQYASLRMPISGDAPTVMALLSRRQLGLPKDGLLDPKRLGGDASIILQLTFPLLNALTVAEIDIKADAELTGFSLRNAIGDVHLTDVAGRVSYANSELSVLGQGKLDGFAAEIAWRNLFTAKAPFRHRYELKGTFPAAMLAKAGFPSAEPYVTGAVGTNVAYQVQPNGAGEVVGRFDLKGAQLTISELAWGKEPGADGKLGMTLKLAPKGKLVSADFDGRANGLIARGQAHFAGDNALQNISLKQFVLGRSDFAFDWKRAAGGVEVSLVGKSLELARLRQALKARDDAAKATPGGAAQAARDKTLFSVHLEQLLVQRGGLGSVNGRLEMMGDRIVSADVAIGGGKGSAFRVTPNGKGRTFGVYVPDFGMLLRDAGWLDGLVASHLDVQGRYDDSQAASPLEGTLKLGPYRMETVVARPGIGTMNSTIEGLNRTGNALQQFNGMEARFTKVGDRIEIREGRTSGQSIGLTTAGVLDLAADTAQLRGVIVPGFALNNLLSNVPLLGPLLTGGKDGGVFAFSYRLSGPLDDLKTDVNMMSAVTPGALRELFTTQGQTSPVDTTPIERLPPPVAP